MPRFFRMGPYELHPARRQLQSSGRPVELGARAFDILCALVEARGAILGKAQLAKLIWADVRVEETNLYVQISAIRRALQPFADWIVNVPGRGYMFAGPIEPAGDDPGVALAAPHRRMAVAVLPFDNLGSDPGQGFFAEGLAEEIIFGLSRVGWLFVIARNSSFLMRDADCPVDEIGAKLGARYLVGGSVRRQGAALRVHCRLTDAESGGDIWVDRFDLPCAEVLDLLDHVVARLVEQLENQILAAEVRRGRQLSAESLAAFDYLLRARAALAHRSEPTYAEAAEALQHALHLDAGCAQARVLQSWCWQVQVVQGWRANISGDIDQILTNCESAVRAAPEDPLVLTYAAGGISYSSTGHAEALALVQRATRQSPSFSFARYMEGWLLLQCEDPGGALPCFREAIALSPLDDMGNASACTAHALSLLHLDRRDEALVWTRRAMARAPDYAYTRRVHIAALAHAGELAEARQVLDSFLRAHPDFCIERYMTFSPLTRSQVQSPIVEGLRLAGCP